MLVMDHKLNLEMVYCKNIFSKAMGLRFHRKITKKAYLFIFKNPLRVSMDMFFVHFKIDVLFLDEKNCVVEIKTGFKPYSLSVW